MKSPLPLFLNSFNTTEGFKSRNLNMFLGFKKLTENGKRKRNKNKKKFWVVGYNKVQFKIIIHYSVEISIETKSKKERS